MTRNFYKTLSLLVAVCLYGLIMESCGTTWAPTSFALNWHLRYVDKDGHNLLEGQFKDSVLTSVPDSVVKVLIRNTHKQSDTDEDWVSVTNQGGGVVYLPFEKMLAINIGEDYVSQKMGESQDYEYTFTVRVPAFMKKDGEADTIRSVWTFNGYQATPKETYRNGQPVSLTYNNENTITMVLDYPQKQSNNE